MTVEGLKIKEISGERKNRMSKEVGFIMRRRRENRRSVDVLSVFHQKIDPHGV